MRAQFHDRLEAIEHDLLRLGELAAAAFQDAVAAFVARDDAGAARWPCRHRSRPISGSSRPSCTAVCTSSGVGTRR